MTVSSLTSLQQSNQFIVVQLVVNILVVSSKTTDELHVTKQCQAIILAESRYFKNIFINFRCQSSTSIIKICQLRQYTFHNVSQFKFILYVDRQRLLKRTNWTNLRNICFDKKLTCHGDNYINLFRSQAGLQGNIVHSILICIFRT